MPSNPLTQFVVRRLRYLVLATPIVVGHNLIHEATHYLAALVFGEGVLEFRFLSNGLGTSQVVFASPVAARTGWHWLVIAWGPSVVTTLIGYALYASRTRPHRNRVALCALYAGFFFLLLDPFYLSVLSLLVGGDIGAASAVGWPLWPVRAAALLVLILNVCLVRRWLEEHGTQYPTIQPRVETPAVRRSVP